MGNAKTPEEEYIESKIMTVAGQVSQINLPELLTGYAAEKSIEFAEWLGNEGWEHYGGETWQSIYNASRKITTELYKEFKI